MEEKLEKLCFLLYLLSAVAAAYLSFKVINVRSACTHERAEITKTLKEIENLKEKNVKLLVEYYSSLKPLNVDENSSDYHLLRENEVKYLK